MGSYGLLRFNIGMTPLGAARLFPLLATLAVIGIIYGALAALAQTDIKRLVAYSSVSHMGFIVLGMFALNADRPGRVGDPDGQPRADDRGPVRLRGHDLRAYHTRDMTQLGGLWNRLPILAFFLILAALGSAAVPGLNGFVGEFPILAGMFQTSARDGRAGGDRHDPGCVLPALDAANGRLRPAARAGARGGDRRWISCRITLRRQHEAIAPIGWHEIAGMTPLMVLIVLIGVFPRPFLDQIRPAVARIERQCASPARPGRPGSARLRHRLRRCRPAQKAGGGASKKSGGQAKAKAKGKTPSAGSSWQERPGHQPRKPPIHNPAHPLPDANREEEKRP